MSDARAPLELFDKNITKVVIGGKDYFVPPLTWGSLRTIFPFIRKNAENPSEDIGEQVYMSAVILSAALIDKNPDLNPDEIMNRIGFADTTPFLASCQELLSKSGFQMMGTPNQGEAQATSFEGDFDRLVAECAARGICGGDWERIEKTMSMPRYKALHAYWNDTPPPDMLIAAYMQAGQFSKTAKRKASRNKPAVSDDGMMPKFDSRGLPIPGARVPRPPELSDKPGTMKDMFELLKRSGRKSITIN